MLEPEGPGPWSIVLGLFCVSLGITIGIIGIFLNLLSYDKSILEKNKIRILCVSPIYGVFSFLSLFFFDYSFIFVTVRDFWDAIVIYSFLNIILQYAGGEAKLCEHITGNSMEHMFPVNFFCDLAHRLSKQDNGWLAKKRIELNSNFLRACRLCTLQFVIIKPLTSILTLILHFMKSRTLDLWLTFEYIIYNASYSIALYALILFYQGTKDCPEVQSNRPLPKFVAVKTIVFATYWQYILLVAISPTLTAEARQRWNALILCLECPIVATLTIFAFPPRDFKSPPPTTISPPAPPSAGKAPTGWIGTSWTSESRRTALVNARDAFGVVDVLQDAVHTFKWRSRSAENWDPADVAEFGD